MATPVLWHFPISHYNEKVRWALDWKGLPHVRRALAAGYLLRALWATGQGRLPILFLEGRAIADSTRIIAALEAHQPDPPLYPADIDARRRALALEDFFDEDLGPHVRATIVGPLFADDPDRAIAALTTGMAPGARRAVRLMGPAFRAFYARRHHITAATVTLGRQKVTAALDRIEAELGPGGYLVGDRFTVADLTAAALFSPLLRPPEFPYPPPEPPEWLDRYREHVLARPAGRWVLDMYRRHRGASAEIAA